MDWACGQAASVSVSLARLAAGSQSSGQHAVWTASRMLRCHRRHTMQQDRSASRPDFETSASELRAWAMACAWAHECMGKPFMKRGTLPRARPRSAQERALLLPWS